MKNFLNRLKTYVVLVRAYSIIDVFLLGLLARTLAVGGIIPPVGRLAYRWQDFIIGLIAFALWGVLTLSLEAKHRHSYRKKIGYAVPNAFLVAASFGAIFFNPRSLIFIFFVWLFTYCYIKKETNAFWGMTSSVWRGLYQAALFFTVWSLYAPATGGLNPLANISLSVVGVAFVVVLFHLSRNLIADVRDVAFDRLTLVVFWGCRKSYIVALGATTVGGTILALLFSNIFVALPGLLMGVLLIIYDDGFMLHRLSIMVTSFTFVLIVMCIHGTNLLYPNLLFLGVVSNFLFYEKVARPSNPIRRVPSHARFLFAQSSIKSTRRPISEASNQRCQAWLTRP